MKKTALMAFVLSLLLHSTVSMAHTEQAPLQKTNMPNPTKVSKTMTPEMLLTMPRVGSFALSPNGKQILYTVSFPNLKENNSRTVLYLINIDGSGKKELTPKGTYSDYNPIWLQSGKEIAFLSSRSGSMQAYKMDLSTGATQNLTNVPGGIDEFKLSPNEKEILFVKHIPFGKTVEQRYPDLDKATGMVIEDLMYKHWDHWVTSIPHPFIASLDQVVTEGTDLLEGEPYEAPMEPFSDLSDFSFSPDGRYLAYACRKKTGLEYSVSTNSDIYLLDRKTNTTTNVSAERKGYDTTPLFSPDGKSLAWISMERDGYESDLQVLAVMDMGTKKMRLVTPQWEYNIAAITWDNNSRDLYSIVCVEAETNIYAINKDNGKVRQITQGTHDYVGMSLQNQTMVAAKQAMTYPTELYRVDLKRGTASQITFETQGIMSQLGEMKCEKRWMPTTNGEKMLTWILYPPHFDASKKYPSILYCQGGPQNTISQFWSYRWNPRLMAEQGYIIILPNRHGVPGFGKAWNEQISKDYGGQNMKDYLQAADLMKKESFIDPDRMGCVGASYGGFSVYWLAGNHKKRFAAFIAHAGIFNLEAQYLETEEKWFANWDMGGAPWEKDNAAAQRTFANSPHKFVGNWDTPILVIHGEKDYRILASQGMMAFDAAKMQGVPTKMLLYPDENHWVLQPQNALLWQRTFFEWLDQWLKK